MRPSRCSLWSSTSANHCEQRGDGAGLPEFVISEFDRYLACGILAQGFARVRCSSCGDEMLVAFSCKGRGFCPSCTTRRMQATATHLLDRVLPQVPMRQWVLSLPRWARLLLARDPRLITRALDITLRAIFSLQRRRARRAGARAPRTGAVTFVQRFGGALNLNVHFHCVIPDGVFVREGEATSFLALSGPSDAEVQEVLGRMVRLLRKLLRPRLEVAQADARAPDALAAAQADSLNLLRGNPPQAVRIKRQAAYLEGFPFTPECTCTPTIARASRICAAMVPGHRWRRIVSRSFPMALLHNAGLRRRMRESSGPSAIAVGDCVARPSRPSETNSEIYSRGGDFGRLPGPTNGSVSRESGVALAQNKVATCAHVVAPGEVPPGATVKNIEVALDDEWVTSVRGASTVRTFLARVVRLDRATDVAILDPGTSFPAVPAEIADAELAEGDEVFFIGHPQFSPAGQPANPGLAIGIGVISAFEEVVLVPNGPRVALLRLDARVNHGNSGGGLFLRSSGRLIGIMNAKAGSLSSGLKALKEYRSSAQALVRGVDPIAALQQTIVEMEQNLQLGIGYAIPISAFVLPQPPPRKVGESSARPEEASSCALSAACAARLKIPGGLRVRSARLQLDPDDFARMVQSNCIDRIRYRLGVVSINCARQPRDVPSALPQPLQLFR